jgi:hypothetical protein
VGSAWRTGRRKSGRTWGRSLWAWGDSWLRANMTRRVRVPRVSGGLRRGRIGWWGGGWMGSSLETRVGRFGCSWGGSADKHHALWRTYHPGGLIDMWKNARLISHCIPAKYSSCTKLQQYQHKSKSICGYIPSEVKPAVQKRDNQCRQPSYE